MAGRFGWQLLPTAYWKQATKEIDETRNIVGSVQSITDEYYVVSFPFRQDFSLLLRWWVEHLQDEEFIADSHIIYADSDYSVRAMSLKSRLEYRDLLSMALVSHEDFYSVGRTQEHAGSYQVYSYRLKTRSSYDLFQYMILGNYNTTLLLKYTSYFSLEMLYSTLPELAIYAWWRIDARQAWYFINYPDAYQKVDDKWYKIVATYQKEYIPDVYALEDIFSASDLSVGVEYVLLASVITGIDDVFSAVDISVAAPYVLDIATQTGIVDAFESVFISVDTDYFIDNTMILSLEDSIQAVNLEIVAEYELYIDSYIVMGEEFRAVALSITATYSIV